jgi:hypothetical protein
MQSKMNPVIRIRIIEDEKGRECVEVQTRGNVEQLESMIFSAMQNDNVITNSVIGAINAHIYKNITEISKVRLN